MPYTPITGGIDDQIIRGALEKRCSDAERQEVGRLIVMIETNMKAVKLERSTVQRTANFGELAALEIVAKLGAFLALNPGAFIEAQSTIDLQEKVP